MKKIIVILILSIMLTSCQPEQENASADEKIVSEPVTVDLSEIPTSEEQNNSIVVLPAPGQRSSEAKLIHLVTLDLSKRLGIDISEVTLIEKKTTTWKDGSLGCPGKGQNYSQEERSGFKIIVEAQNIEYTYHTDGLEKFILCEDDGPVPPMDEINQPAP